MAKAYVKSETPQELVELFYAVLTAAKDSGRVKKGINEVTKSVERNNAKVVAMAMDVDPEEIMMHLPKLCEEKGIPYVYVQTKQELGKMAGLNVPTSSVAIEDAGTEKEKLRTLVERLTGKALPAEEKGKETKETKEAKEKKQEQQEQKVVEEKAKKKQPKKE
ncbi:MAG: 50S ribosomal protein L7Ae [Candidatus Anstonellales archaeon]